MAAVESLNSEILASMDNKLGSCLNQGEKLIKAVQDNGKAYKAGIASLGKNLSKSFSLKSLGNKISDTFNKGIKGLTSPFKSLGSKISSAFSGLKTKITNFKPFEALKGKLAAVAKKPVTAVKTLLGKNDEQLKRKFFRVWSNPKRVAKILGREFNKNKNMSKEGAKAAADVSAKGDATLQIVDRFFKMLDKFVTKLLVKLVVAVHGAIGPYVLLICGVIILLALLFKDQIKEIIPIFTRVLDCIVDVIEILTDGIGKTLQKLLELVADVVDTIVSAIGSVLKSIADIIVNIFGLVNDVVSLFREVYGLFADIALAILTPIRDAVVALQPLFQKIVGLISKFANAPLETAAQVGKSVVGGIKNLVGSIGNKEGKQENPILTFLKNVREILNNFVEKFKESKIEAWNSLFTKFKQSKIYGILVEMGNKTIEFQTEILHLIRYIQDIIKNVFGKVSETITKSIQNISSIFENITNRLKNLFSFGSKTNTTAETIDNKEKEELFSNLISGFEKMRADTVQLLTIIKDAVVSISKNRIEIGNTMATNNAQTSDGTQTNNLQNITLNYNVDINKILDKMDETNNKLNGILNNTAITDSGVQKAGSIWSI
jgi:phage-related protein